MLSIPKVIQYVQNTTDINILQDYFDRASEGMKQTNKRSNLISQFILVLIVLTFFPSSIHKLKIFDAEFDPKIIKILTPTLLSYLIFEWLMVAKRRRDLIFALQQISYKIFKIHPEDDEKYFPNFNPNSLNLMPFSLMSEVGSINTTQKPFKLILTRITIVSIPVCLIIVIICSLIQSIDIYNLHFQLIWPSSIQDFIDEFCLYVCIGISLLFIFWSSFYYWTEFENLDIIRSSNKKSQTDQ
jgi:hypothetical protein